MQRLLAPICLLIFTLFAPGVFAEGEQAAQNTPAPSEPGIEQRLSALQEKLVRFGSASQQEIIPERYHDELAFRRDDLLIGILQELRTVLPQVAALPAEYPERETIVSQLREQYRVIGDSVVQRIRELTKGIEQRQDTIADLSGAERATAEAWVHAMETRRFRAYQALVELVLAARAAEFSDDGLSDRLEPVLRAHAEALVGRIELRGALLAELRSRSAVSPENADVTAAGNEIKWQQQHDLTNLGTMIGLLEQLGQKPEQYRAVMVKQGQGLTFSAIREGTLLTLMAESWHALRESLVNRAPDFLFNVLLFVVILLVFRALARLAKGAVRSACERPGVRMTTLLKDVTVSLTGSVIMVFGFLVALAQMGISLGPMLAGLGVAGFIVGFALQDTLGNFAAGGMILLYRPYDVDDFVEVAGAAGFVKKMSLVSTTITTFDNQTLVVPNSKIWGDVIKNVTAQKLRRVDLVFGISYGDDIEKAEGILLAVLEEHPLVLEKPESKVKVHELGDSSVNFVVRPWVKTADYWDVYWDITREVKLRFDREGVTIPFPQRDVHFHTADGPGHDAAAPS